MTILGALLILVIYWKISYSPYKAKFDKEMEKRLNQTEVNEQVCTKEEIEKLPQALQKYCEYIGLVGSKKNNAVNVNFMNTKFVFDAKSGTILNMDYDLWLFADKPFRSAYCMSSMYGIPFDGIDYCNEQNEGGMKGIIGKAIQIFDTHNEQMYVAGMISWLSESFGVNPCVILSPYITYEEIDETHINATVSYNGVQGTGTFVFDEDGKLLYFESDERQVEEIDGVMTPIGWRAEYDEYKEFNGIKIPSIMKAIKEYPDKEVVYFDSNDANIIWHR